MTAARIGVMLAAGLAGGPFRAEAADERDIVVLTSSSVPAYTLAVEGIREALPARAIRVVDLEATPDPRAALARAPALVVALGAHAAAAAAATAAAPIIATMVLFADGPTGHPSVLTHVYLDIPLEPLLPRLKEIFPGRTRLGLIRNPARRGPPLDRWHVHAREQGFTFRVADCSGPEELLKTFRGFQGNADLVWCMPDSVLFNSGTAKPLIMASLEMRLPIIGFSESFVRAGAAAGVYPDFKDIGQQAGLLAARYLNGQSVPPFEMPRRLHIAINDRIARLLGLHYEVPRGDEVSVLR